MSMLIALDVPVVLVVLVAQVVPAVHVVPDVPAPFVDGFP